MMHAGEVIISQVSAQEITFHGEQLYPEECCGMLLGTYSDNMRSIAQMLPLANSDVNNRKNRFLLTPEQYTIAEKHARERRLELLGIYHSHPNHPAMPSQFDRMYALPWFVYLIVPVEEKHAKKMTAWVLNEDRSRFIEQRIIMHTMALQGSTINSLFE